MIKVYSSILKISIVCAIITFLSIELTLVLGVVLPASNSGNTIIKDERITISSKENLSYTQEDEAILNGIGEFFSSIGEELHGLAFALLIEIVLIISFIIAFAIFVYVLLYFISWRLLKKEENKKKVISSFVLTGIACIIQITIIFFLTKFLTSESSIQLPFLIADISEIISVIFTITILVLNKSKIKEICSKK